eukprot:1138747-Pelagomonas_calceolata.AAC.4
MATTQCFDTLLGRGGGWESRGRGKGTGGDKEAVAKAAVDVVGRRQCLAAAALLFARRGIDWDVAVTAAAAAAKVTQT